MIITKKVLIEVSNRNIFHFTKKLKSYYDLKVGFNEICVKDLSEGSHVIVEVECDSCLVVLKMEYRSYLKFTKNETEIYCCKKCNNVKVRKTNLERYGVVSNSQLKSNKKMVKEKWKNKTEVEKNIIVNNRKETCIEKYGVDTYTKTEEYKIKSKETWMERYGVENPSYSDEIKQKRVDTKMKKFGFCNNSQTEDWKNRIYEIWHNRTKVEVDEILRKRKITCNIKYGVDSYSQTEDWREKIVETCINKYGYPSHNQCPFIHDKQQKSGLKNKSYNDLKYQGTYELDFLERYYERLNIGKVEPIRYKHNDKYHYYHPDFYIPDYNLIVEIKSTYTYNYDLDRNQAKRDYSIRAGYNFMFIIDKDYTDFEGLL